MEMEMLMERTLGMLVGAELVQQYDKLEKCTNTHHGSGPLWDTILKFWTDFGVEWMRPQVGS